MDKKKKRIAAAFFVFLSAVSIIKAALPEINKNNLIEAIKFSDSLQTNLDSKYIVDEEFNEAIHGDRMPAERKLEIQWRQDGIRNYYDVTVHDGEYIQDKPFRFVTSFDGEYRKQWIPNENKGDVFKEPHKSSWPIPIDFGLTLGKHDKKLGESLGECKIETIRKIDWDDNQCYYIEAFQPNGAKAEVWIDPKIGWRARNVKLYRTDGLIMYEATADFNDMGNGIYFPTKGTAKLYGKDPNTGERVVSCVRNLKIEEVKVNTELTQEDFNIKFPQDTEVYDHIYGIGYIVGVTSLYGINDETLNDITEVVKTEKVPVIENSTEAKQSLAKDAIEPKKEAEAISEDKTVITPELSKSRGELKKDSKNSPIKPINNKINPVLWWLIAPLIASALCIIFVFVRRKIA